MPDGGQAQHANRTAASPGQAQGGAPAGDAPAFMLMLAQAQLASASLEALAGMQPSGSASMAAAPQAQEPQQSRSLTLQQAWQAIAAQAARLSQRHRRARGSLQLDRLGTIGVRAERTASGRLTVRITAERPEAAAALSRRINELRDQLAALGERDLDIEATMAEPATADREPTAGAAMP